MGQFYVFFSISVFYFIFPENKNVLMFYIAILNTVLKQFPLGTYVIFKTIYNTGT